MIMLSLDWGFLRDYTADLKLVQWTAIGAEVYEDLVQDNQEWRRGGRNTCERILRRDMLSEEELGKSANWTGDYTLEDAMIMALVLAQKGLRIFYRENPDAVYANKEEFARMAKEYLQAEKHRKYE